jgi:hypothetical protein
MLPVPVRFGISPGEYSAGRHICNVVLYRFAQNMDMSVPTNGQTPEAHSRTRHVLKTAVSMKQQFLEHAVF